MEEDCDIRILSRPFVGGHIRHDGAECLIEVMIVASGGAGVGMKPLYTLQSWKNGI